MKTTQAIFQTLTIKCGDVLLVDGDAVDAESVEEFLTRFHAKHGFRPLCITTQSSLALKSVSSEEASSEETEPSLPTADLVTLFAVGYPGQMANEFVFDNPEAAAKVTEGNHQKSREISAVRFSDGRIFHCLPEPLTVYSDPTDILRGQALKKLSDAEKEALELADMAEPTFT